ncbi:hypothetical protein LTR56_022631 [Elasticomyces elasticus]|nr:hypothetical protein LTR56_022631 [Elasticomyces elasticus]KAK3628402.1 hypothetical protein LTR22_022363 [Elasticomyces elasticus]KAK4905774.1 hypothetical protein LTR49_024980 [Elasticomyces elasticus]KAK5743236.1 hypothetical protein LTS12_023924 [Elasticomyces elasticus]
MAGHIDITAPMLDLSPELIELIALAVPPDDLLALRQTCYTIRDCVQHTFVQTNFTEKTFLLPCAESMQALVEISKHNVFRKAIKKVNFVVQWLRSSQPEQPLFAQRKETCSREQRAQARDSIRRHGQAYAEQRQYYSHGDWSFALEEALQNFSKSAGSMSIEFANAWTARASACGTRRLKRLFADPTLTIGPIPDVHGATFLRTIVRGSCPISNFAATGLVWGLDLPLKLIKVVPGPQPTPTLFAGLRALNTFVDHQCWRHGAAEDVQHVFSFFRGAQTVEHLTLRTISPTSTDRFDGFANTAYLPSLQRLTFFAAFPWPENIVRFCKRHELTLKHVEANDIDPLIFDEIMDPARVQLNQAVPSITFSEPDRDEQDEDHAVIGGLPDGLEEA